MTFEIKQDDYILGFWSAGKGNGDSWYCICLKRKDDNQWIGQYAFRYRKDDKIFDSDDEKSRYEFKGPLIPEDEQIKIMDKFAALAQLEYNKNIEREIIKGDANEFRKFAIRSKNLHIKIEPNKQW